MLKENIILSVIIPIYNVEYYLERCLDSIKDQVEKDIEVIMINDGSTDNSYEIAKKYENSNDNFILYNQVNKGLGSARNLGISKASGRYLWFVDSDDSIRNDSIYLIRNIIDKNKYINIISIDVEINNNNKRKYINKKIQESCITTNKKLYEKGYIYPFSGAVFYIVKRNYLISNKLFFKENVYFEDLLYTPLLLSHTKYSYYLKESLYLYDLRDNSITTSNNSLKKCSDLIEITKCLYFHYKKMTKEEDRYILKKSLISIIGTFNKYCIGLNSKEKTTVRKMYFENSFFLSFLIKDLNIKYLIRYIQMHILY